MRGDPSQPVEQHPSPVGPLSILYVGAPEGTAAQRARILGELGHRVRTVEAGIPLRTSWRYQIHRVVRRIKRPGAPLAPFRDLLGANRATARRAAEAPLDVLWVDKGLSIRPETLQAVRTARPSSVSVSFSLDDMLNPVHQSQAYLACIPLYDLHVTTKSYHVEELARLGARRVLFVDNGYDPQGHTPAEWTKLFHADLKRYAEITRAAKIEPQ